MSTLDLYPVQSEKISLEKLLKMQEQGKLLDVSSIEIIPASLDFGDLEISDVSSSDDSFGHAIIHFKSPKYYTK